MSRYKASKASRN